MRIILKKGKQKKLILLAKKKLTWKQLAEILKISYTYLSGDLKNEKVLISEEVYKKLCDISKINFDEFIVKRLADNWGKSKGGLNSLGSTKQLPKIEFNECLAEFVGAVLGDGHVHSTKKDFKDRKVGVYHVRIAGDLNLDKEYHHYLGELGERLFDLKFKITLIKKGNERFLNFYSKELVNFFISMGINPGNKIVNQSTIPKWIYRNKNFLKACLRGLIDTDGCIHRMSKKDPNLLRINFKNNNLQLLKDTLNGFILLGFHPSKIICNNVFYISRQNEIEKYLKEIGFSNKKHKDRVKSFQSPVV